MSSVAYWYVISKLAPSWTAWTSAAVAQTPSRHGSDRLWQRRGCRMSECLKTPSNARPVIAFIFARTLRTRCACCCHAGVLCCAAMSLRTRGHASGASTSVSTVAGYTTSGSVRVAAVRCAASHTPATCASADCRVRARSVARTYTSRASASTSGSRPKCVPYTARTAAPSAACCARPRSVSWPTAHVPRHSAGASALAAGLPTASTAPSAPAPTPVSATCSAFAHAHVYASSPRTIRFTGVRSPCRTTADTCATRYPATGNACARGSGASQYTYGSSPSAPPTRSSNSPWAKTVFKNSFIRSVVSSSFFFFRCVFRFFEKALMFMFVVVRCCL